jgi:nickel/cobalt transporter (NicO) family protein
MPDWLMSYLASLQGGIVRTLATELRAGGMGAMTLAFALGALHALTPGHGKAALAAYFIGTEARLGKGVRVALTAALLHVLSGFLAFLVLRFVIGQAPSISGRGSPAFTAFGYALIVGAGIIMVFQSVRPAHAHGDGGHTLTAGIGLLPCPLTISVLGFAWIQGNSLMVGMVLISLALGISLTIGTVALLAILARNTLGAVLGEYLRGLEGAARLVQGFAGALIIVIGLYTLSSLKF